MRIFLTCFSAAVCYLLNTVLSVFYPSVDVKASLEQMSLEGAAATNRAIESSGSFTWIFSVLFLISILVIWFKPAKEFLKEKC